MHSRFFPVWLAASLLILHTGHALGSAEEVFEPTLTDKAHREITESLSVPARWFDNFFQDPRLDEEPAGTSLRLRGSFIAEEGKGLSFKGKIKARLHLPNLARRFHLILSGEDEDLRDDELKDTRVNQELADGQRTSLALQYTQRRSARFSLAHRLKLDLEESLNPQISSRVRLSIPIGKESLLTMTQAVLWENEEGFGEESRIDHDLAVSKSILIRTTGRGFYSESSNGYEWLAMNQWLQSFSHKKALAIGALVTGETRPQNRVTEYNSFAKYRQRIIKKWLYLELKPEVKWSRERDFKPIGLFTMTFEIQFED